MSQKRTFLALILFLFLARLAGAASLPTPILASPANGATDAVTGPLLDWGNVTGATNYRVFVHENKAVLQAITGSQTTCSGCKVNAYTTSSMWRTSYSAPLDPWRQYYWMVRAGNSTTGSVSQKSQIWSFKTGDKPVVISYSDGGILGFDYYIIKVRLDAGARVEPYLGANQTGSSATNTCLGSGHNYFQFGAKNVSGFIGSSAEVAGSRIVISGSFHNGQASESYLYPSFPQKIRGKIETFGRDCTNSSQGRMLEIRASDGRAFVAPFDLMKFKSTTIAPNVIVGLHPDYDKSGIYPIGRNFACVKDASGGGYRTMLFLVTDGLTRAKVEELLLAQGCTADLMIQFDGNTVAQLSEKVGSAWQHRITDSRTMPQFFAIFEPK